MTVKDLKGMLSKLDDSCMITMQKPDGTQREITKASMHGKHFTFWTDR